MMTAQTPTLATSERSLPALEREQRPPRWIEVMPHLDPSFGGMSSAVPQLGSRLALSENFMVTVAAFCDQEEHATLDHFPDLTLTRWPLSRAAWLSKLNLHRQFRSLLSTADGVHIHGLWESSSVVAALTARSLRRPYVLSAHGMLEPWALSNKGLKKKIYSAVVERANVEGAACLHALTSTEAEDYRRFGSKRPIAVIPNGVDLPASADPASFLERFPQVRDKRIILFLGRIHYKKGLDLLVQVWASIASEYPDAILVLAGPDSEKSQASLEIEIEKKGIRDRVLFTGMLDAQIKWSALAAAQLFVLPSYSEGFSVAILEAMGMGLPVIVTTACHLPEVRSSRAGWQIRPDPLELQAALQDALANSLAANRTIGKRGERLVRERFSWAAVSAQMADLYRWVQGGPPPHTFSFMRPSDELWRATQSLQELLVPPGTVRHLACRLDVSRPSPFPLYAVAFLRFPHFPSPNLRRKCGKRRCHSF